MKSVAAKGADLRVIRSGRASEPEILARSLAGRLLRSRVPVLLGALDGLLLLATYTATVVLLDPYTFDLRATVAHRMLVWYVVLLGCWFPVAVNLRAYTRAVFEDPLRSAYVTAKAALIAGALFHLVPLVGGPVYSRVASLTVVLLMVAVLVVWRLLASRVLAAIATPLDLVVVGAGWAGRTLAEAVALRPHASMRIVAFVDSDPTIIGTTQHGLPVRSVDELAEVVRPYGRRVRVVLAIPDEAHATVYEQLTTLAQHGIKVASMASVYEQVTGRVPVRHLGNSWWASLPTPSEDILYIGAKRLIDVCLSAVGLVALAILLPIIACVQRIESPGPVFFVQERVGWHGKPLRVVKLRTLPATRRQFATYWERKQSNQASRLGALMRATGIDELPQCWNVLLGQMSFVGPRPYVPEEVADFQRDIPFFRSRSLVKPGLTGWAQINWGYGLSLEDEIEKLQYDLYYVGHQSLYLDLLIILRTVGLALSRRRPGNAAIGNVVTARGDKAAIPPVGEIAQP